MMENPPPPLGFYCPKKWEAMRVDGPRRRFCDQCQLHVHDLSAMSKLEGERVIAQADGQTCVSYAVRPDGTMITRTRWSGLEQRWNALRRGVFALLAALAPLSLGACAHRADISRTGGKVCVSDADGKDSTTAGKINPEETRLTGAIAPPKP